MIKLLNTLRISDIKNFENIFNGLAKVITIEGDRKRVLSELYNTQAYLASAKIEVDKAFLNRAPLLKIIGSPSTGTDHLDLDEISRRKIKCFDISKEYNLLKTFSATAELTFALILSLSRKIIAANFDAKQGLWSREKFTGTQLLNKNLGIIGLGRLGKITAKIGLGFGMRVYAFDTNKKKKMKNVINVSLEKLANISDVISIHIHLSKATINFIDHSFLNKMKKNAILINTSRGRIVNEEALLSALKEKVIAGAGLDVIDGEWLSKAQIKNHALIKYSNMNDNLVITPHIGGSTTESIKNARVFMAKKVASELKKYKKS